MDSVEDAIGAKLGKPVVDYNTDDVDIVVWYLKGQGVVITSEEASSLIVQDTISKQGVFELVDLVVNIVDSDNDTRYKNYDIDKKAKILSYQPYEKNGSSRAKKRLTTLLKKFNLNGWTLNMEEAHR